MSLKVKALVQTLGLIALAIFVASTISFILANVSTETIMQALSIGLVSWLVYMFYSIRLLSLEYEQKLKETKETIQG